MMIIKRQKSLKVLAPLVLILLLIITLATVASGCSCTVRRSHSLTVVNPASNNMPFHASIDGKVGSRAPKIDPGESHTFTFYEKERWDRDNKEADFEPLMIFLTISRDGHIFGEDIIEFWGNHYTVTVYEDGMGVSFDVKSK